MIKTVFWTLRVPDWLDTTTRDAAKKRDMNLSEYVRYVLTRHFDDDYAEQPSVDIEIVNSPHNLP